MRPINVASAALGVALMFGGNASAATLQCVDFVKQELGKGTFATRSFTALTGDANTWYGKAKGVSKSAVSSTPSVGAIIVFAGTGDKKNGAGVTFPTYGKGATQWGHVALITKVVSSSSIKVDQANWPQGRGIDRGVGVQTSDKWLTGRVEYWPDPKHPLGVTPYNVLGFINTAAFPLKKK